MDLLVTFGGIAMVALLAAMSPGPDFLVVAKNSISHSRKIGMYTALGVALGCCVHVGYVLVGLGFVISRSVLLFSVIKFAGAVYLVYLGVMLMTSKEESEVHVAQEASSQKSSYEAFKEGLLTNVLNPKATLFFLSVFSQFVSPALPISVRASLGLETVAVVGLWFVVLAAVLTHPSVRKVIARVQNSVLKFMGAALVLLGVKLASSQQ